MPMNFSFALGIVFLIVAFGAVYALNYDFSSGKAKEGATAFNAPYTFQPGEFTSYLNAFFFVFIFSLLFFGYSAPIALGIEGAKYASLYIAGALKPYDFIFLLPQLIGAYAAIVMGSGVLNDFEGNTVFEKWNRAIKFFAIGLVLVVALSLIRPFLI